MNLECLIVDDEPEIGLLLGSSLKKWNWNVAKCGTITEGSQLLKEHSFSLIFLDLNLPDGNGRSLLAEINHLYPYSAVVLMSAHHDSLMQEVPEEDLIISRVKKPFRLKDIKTLLEENGLVKKES